MQLSHLAGTYGLGRARSSVRAAQRPQLRQTGVSRSRTTGEGRGTSMTKHLGGRLKTQETVVKTQDEALGQNKASMSAKVLECLDQRAPPGPVRLPEPCLARSGERGHRQKGRSRRAHSTQQRGPGPGGTCRGAWRGPQRRDRYLGTEHGGVRESAGREDGVPFREGRQVRGARAGTATVPSPSRGAEGQQGLPPPTPARTGAALEREGGGRAGWRAGGRAGGRARGTGRRARARRGPGSCPQRLPGGRRWRRGRACSGARRAYRGREVPGPPGRWRPGRGAGGDGRVARGGAGTAAAAAARGGGGTGGRWRSRGGRSSLFVFVARWLPASYHVTRTRGRPLQRHRGRGSPCHLALGLRPARRGPPHPAALHPAAHSRTR